MKVILQKYISEFVYGGVDGTVTTFAIVTGAVAAELSASTVVVLGAANVLADAFSMASSNYLSEQADQSTTNSPRKHKSPFMSALVTFGAFVLVGLVPILAFILEIIGVPLGVDTLLLASILTAIAFIFIGVVRSSMSGESLLKTCLQTLIIGGIAATISYVVGGILHGIIE